MAFASKFADAIEEVVSIDNLVASKTLQLVGEEPKLPGEDVVPKVAAADPAKRRKSAAAGRSKTKQAKVATGASAADASASAAVHLVEQVDRRLVKWLVDNFDSLPVEYTRSKNKDTMKVFMKRYLQKLTKKGEARVEYNQIQGHGRYLNPVCLQGMDRVLRHTIARDNYIDVDIVNCHFVLLEQYCEANDIDHTCLTDYITNRDAYVAGVMEEEKVDKDTAKVQYFIKALYGGKPKTRYAPFNQFANELLAIRQAVMTARGPELLKYVNEDKEWNRDGSALCHMMQGIENDVLMTMCEFMKQENVEVGVLVFDGLMLRKSEATADVDALLTRCEQYILEKTEWRVKLIEKPMTQGLTEEQLSTFRAGSGNGGDGDGNGNGDASNGSSYRELEGVEGLVKSFFELVLNDRHAIVEHAVYAKLVAPALQGSLVFTETKGFVHAKTVWEQYTENKVANRLVLPYMKQLVNPVIARLQDDISSVRAEIEQLNSSRDDQEDNAEQLQKLEKSLKNKQGRLDQYQLIRSFCGKAGNISGVVSCIESDETLEDKDNELGLKLDTSPDLFAVKNGVINTRTGELRPIVPEDFISMTTDYNYFDDNNPFDQNVYENMLRFIHQILPVEEERAVFRLYCYYCLLAKHNLRIFAILTDLSGGATGKTNLLQLMFMAFSVYGIKGDKALVVRSDNKHNNLNGQSVGVLQMLGRRAAYFDEFSARSVLDDEELKEKTCGNPSGRGRKMRANDYITFPWLAKYFLLFNQSNLSGFDFTDQALLSRMLVIVFRAKFCVDAEEYEKFKHQQYVYMADQDIAANYPAWAPYALHWLLGVKDQFHATSNPFAVLPETCRKWKRDLVGDQNIVQEFIDNYTEQLTEPVPLMDANGRPVLKKVEIVGATGAVTYEQEPVLDDNGVPVREHGGTAMTRPRLTNVMLQPTDCYISMKDAWDLFKDIYKDNEKDRSKALGKSKFVMEFRRIVGKDGFTEGKSSTQIGPHKARPNDYYLGYRLIVPTTHRRHGA